MIVIRVYDICLGYYIALAVSHNCQHDNLKRKRSGDPIISLELPIAAADKKFICPAQRSGV